MSTRVRACGKIAAVLIAFSFLSTTAYILFAAGKNEPLRQLSSPANPNKVCGPWAFLVAATRQGVPLSFSKVKQDLPITETGVSFGDLVKYARKHGLSTELRTMPWNELKTVQAPVILWVDGSHFFTVDPRQVHPEGKDLLRRYDFGTPAVWYSREELEKRWKGQSLVIRRNTSSNSRTGPKIRWEKCFDDLGWVDPHQKIHLFKYSFKNLGSEPLELSVGKVGCGCAKANITPKSVEPGEKGLVTVTVDISEKRGYFSTSVLLNTNDASASKCPVIVSGGVLQPVLTSVDTIYLGQVFRGDNLTKSFFVHDRGDKTLKIRDIEAVIDTEGVFADSITCEVLSTRIYATSTLEKPVSRYHVKLGDYLARLKIQISPDAPLGSFKGRVLIETNQSDRFKSSVVSFKGTVITDVYAEPRALLLSRREPNARILLKSNQGKTVEIPSLPATLSGSANLLVKPTGTSSSSPAYEVSVAEFKDNGVQNARIVFHLNDKSSLTVPVIVYNSNH